MSDINGNIKNSFAYNCFAMYDILRAWNKVARKYRNGEITKRRIR